MFKIGEKIIYPMYGAGVVDNIEEKERDEDALYLIRILKGNLQIKVPAKKADIIGVRLVSKAHEINVAFDEVGKLPVIMQQNWNIRYKENLKKIKTGNLLDIVEVARNLMLRERERELSGIEKKMLTNIKQMVVTEIAYAYEITDDKAEEFLAKKLLY